MFLVKMVKFSKQKPKELKALVVIKYKNSNDFLNDVTNFSITGLISTLKIFNIVFLRIFTI